MNYMELMEKSREVMGTKLCKSCPVCDGKACRNTMPGPGAKGIGDVAMRNYDAWKNIRVNMDTITDNEPVSTELELKYHYIHYHRMHLNSAFLQLLQALQKSDI